MNIYPLPMHNQNITLQKTDNEVQQSSDFSQNYFDRIFLKTCNIKFCPCIFLLLSPSFAGAQNTCLACPVIQLW